jgi:hypothetical protein
MSEQGVTIRTLSPGLAKPKAPLPVVLSTAFLAAGSKSSMDFGVLR